jgi:hypothetical protein
MAYPDHLAFIRYPLFIYRRGLFREINYVGWDHCKRGSFFVSTQSRRYKLIRFW